MLEVDTALEGGKQAAFVQGKRAATAEA
jgi:hypothetical protein